MPIALYIVIAVVVLIVATMIFVFMLSNNNAVKTKNVYGKIIITDNTVARFVSHVATDCYGIVKFVPTSVFNAVINFIKFKREVKGVKVRTSGDRITIDMAVVVKYGVSIKAVIEALKESIKYKVEKFSGMIVDTINVKVISIEK